MPMSRRSAASAGPTLGNCSSVSHSATLAAFGRFMRASHQHVVADQADRETFDLEPGLGVAGAHVDRLELAIFRNELDAGSRALEALHGDVVVDARHDDLAVLR